MSSDPVLEQHFQQHLRELRPLLLNLHKALMEQERSAYEQAYGPIATKGEYFQLVLGHERFNWLRPISQAIVRIDELLSAKKPETSEPAEAILVDVRGLLSPLADGSIAEQRYYLAIQHNPEIALMHAAAARILDRP
ncbi:hypothetical protein [Altericista sp. CCNU0014]|uniref:hypothetical protein n=1 Tax=Altericista sp. CCNU0014 TaxID=3082949 RepID=UPI00384EAA94